MLTSLRNSDAPLRCSSRRRTGKGANRVAIETHVPTSAARRLRLVTAPSVSNEREVPIASSFVRVVMESEESAASELSASPRKPYDASRCRSSKSPSFDVVCEGDAIEIGGGDTLAIVGNLEQLDAVLF